MAKLTFTNKAVGNYVMNDTNFPGLGQYIPGWVLVIGNTVANITFSTSNDGGTTWFANSSTGTFWVYVDSGSTVRINVATGATTINLYPMA